MKARLNAVQRALWALVLASVVLGVLAFPRGHNREYTAALDELSAFRDAFKQAELESSLLDYARAQGVVQLAQVQPLITGPGVPKVTLGAKPEPIAPLGEIHLRTLAEIVEHARPNSTLDIGSVAPAPLAAAIAWRLARRQPAEGKAPAHELASITLEPAQFTEPDIALEAEIAQLRLDTLAAERATADAATKLTRAEELFEARRKRRLPWKILIKSDEARKEAKLAWSERQRTFEETRTRYEAQVKRAEDNGKKPAAAGGKLPGTHALAKVSLRADSAEPVEMRIPIALVPLEAKLPPLAGTAFSATREAGLWDEVKDLTAAQAIELTRGKFTWHYRYAEIAGLRVGGMTVLQFTPLFLPLILFLLLSRIRNVSGSYNPFGTTLDQKLPRVGLGSRLLELGVLVVLPLVAVGLTVVALWAVSQAPIVPALAAVAAIGLGAYAFMELGSLQALIEAVVRSHSNPPAKPESETL